MQQECHLLPPAAGLFLFPVPRRRLTIPPQPPTQFRLPWLVTLERWVGPVKLRVGILSLITFAALC
jgi:hypothetical protein